MADITPTTSDRTVVVQRHSALTYISLGFNALVLLLILCGIAADHHRKANADRERGPVEHRQWAGDRDDGRFDRHEMNSRHEWKHREFGRDEGMAGCPMDEGPDRHAGFGGGPRGGFGGDMHPGFGGFDHGPMTPPSAEAMTDRFMLTLAEKLSLTDDESAKIRPIVHDGIAQFQKDLETQKQAHEKMLQDAKTKVRAVLTPDQQKQFDEMTVGMGGPPPAPAK